MLAHIENLEIDEVTTGMSLSTETSLTTKSTMPLNSGINLEKCEFPCQVKDLNLDGQVPPQGIQPTETWETCKNM